MGLLKKKEKKEEPKAAAPPTPVALLEAGITQEVVLGMDKAGTPTFSLKLETAPLDAEQVAAIMGQLNERNVLVIGVYERDDTQENDNKPE